MVDADPDHARFHRTEITAASAVRRRLLVGPLAFVSGLGACSGTAPMRLSLPMRPREIANGVFLVDGDPDEASVANGARTANLVFIVSNNGILVWNSGVSYRQGQELLNVIRTVSDRPIRALVINHPYQDVLFGARAFADANIPVWMHEKSNELMRQRCDQCLRNLRRLLGDATMAGTDLVKPDRLIRATERIDLIGRPLLIIYPGASSGPGDLALFDPSTGTLLSGGMVSVRRVPEIRDAKFQDWIRALGALSTFPIQRIVPNNGPIGGAADIASTIGYLRALEAKVAQVMKSGVSLAELTGKVDITEYAAWQGYERQHYLNASRVYIRQEEALFE